MRPYTPFLFFALILACCKEQKRNEQKPATTEPPHVITPYSEPSIIDTVRKYGDTGSINISYNGHHLSDYFYTGQVNHRRFALYVSLDFDEMYFYQKAQGAWQQPDTLHGHSVNFEAFESKDFNADGAPDICFFDQGRRWVTAFVYDPHTKRFNHSHKYCKQDSD